MALCICDVCSEPSVEPLPSPPPPPPPPRPEQALELGLPIMGCLRGYAVVGVDPKVMGIGPSPPPPPPSPLPTPIVAV